MSRLVGGPIVGTRRLLLEPGEEIVKPRCTHQQAEPVVLSTGETVACVCIICLSALSADWVTNQRRRAEQTAHCAHDDLIELGMFGQHPADADRICRDCGAWNP